MARGNRTANRMSSRSITMPDRELSFVKRHFGTDVLAAGWLLLLLATFFYTAYSILFLMEMWGDTFPRVFFAWDNLMASLVFVVAGVYFALLGYPAELEEFESGVRWASIWTNYHGEKSTSRRTNF